MHEINGTTGPLRDVSVTREKGTFSTTYSASGTLDLADLQTGLTADPDVVASLSNQQVDVNAIDQTLLADIRDAFGLTVKVELPGGTTTVAGTSGKTATIDASTSVLDTKRVVLVVRRGRARGAGDPGAAVARASGRRGAARGAEPRREVHQRVEHGRRARVAQLRRRMGPRRDRDHVRTRARRSAHVVGRVAHVDRRPPRRSACRPCRRRSATRTPRPRSDRRARGTGARSARTWRSPRRPDPRRRAPRRRRRARRAGARCRARRTRRRARGTGRTSGAASSAGKRSPNSRSRLRRSRASSMSSPATGAPVSAPSASRVARMPGRESTRVMSRSNPTTSCGTHGLLASSASPWLTHERAGTRSP